MENKARVHLLRNHLATKKPSRKLGRKNPFFRGKTGSSRGFSLKRFPPVKGGFTKGGFERASQRGGRGFSPRPKKARRENPPVGKKGNIFEGESPPQARVGSSLRTGGGGLFESHARDFLLSKKGGVHSFSQTRGSPYSPPLTERNGGGGRSIPPTLFFLGVAFTTPPSPPSWLSRQRSPCVLSIWC